MVYLNTNFQDFLEKTYTEPVYTQIDVLDYNKRIDGKNLGNTDFYKNPTEYISDFEHSCLILSIFGVKIRKIVKKIK